MSDSRVTNTRRPVGEPIFEELGLVHDAANPFHATLARLLQAAELVGLPHHQRIILAQPASEIMVHFPVLMDDGRHRLFKGYRIQHNHALGPFLGGVRFHPRITLDETKALAALGTLSASLARVGFGGAMGGVRCSPTELSEAELMRVARRFTVAIGHHLGPDQDVVTTDLGTDARVMAWMADTLQQVAPTHGKLDAMRAVTGKPIEIGGSYGRAVAVGHGLAEAAVEMLPELSMPAEGTSVAIAGFGTVGAWAARRLHEYGLRVVSVLDATAGVADPAGLDPFRLAEHVARSGGVERFPRGAAITAAEFWAMPVDLLVLAAGDGQVDEPLARTLGARVVLEGSQLPITAAADEVLAARGIDVLPSILCRAGGTIVSSFEWIQNRVAATWTGEQVDEELRRSMQLAARRVKLARIRYECDWRTAAACAALARIGRVYDLRGVFP
jgi:glutamate dehydrogenase (NAD(P)+)